MQCQYNGPTIDHKAECNGSNCDCPSPDTIIESLRTELKEAREEVERLKEVNATETSYYQDHVMHCFKCGNGYWDKEYAGICPICRAEKAEAREEELEEVEVNLMEAKELWRKLAGERAILLEKAEAKLYHEIVKNNSDRARVEFLEEKLFTDCPLSTDGTCKDLTALEADSKRKQKTLKHIAESIRLTPHMDLGELSTLAYLAEQAIKGE